MRDGLARRAGGAGVGLGDGMMPECWCGNDLCIPRTGKKGEDGQGDVLFVDLCPWELIGGGPAVRVPPKALGIPPFKQNPKVQREGTPPSQEFHAPQRMSMIEKRQQDITILVSDCIPRDK